MPGRRSAQRFTLSVPWEGTLRVPGDVTIERYGEEHVWVLSSTPASRNEVLTLDVPGSTLPVTVSVRVADSVPVLIDGVLRHRLQLEILS